MAVKGECAMIENDYVFGKSDVLCDFKNCRHELHVEGCDNHLPDFKDIRREMDEQGWTSKRVDGEWQYFCLLHSGK